MTISNFKGDCKNLFYLFECDFLGREIVKKRKSQVVDYFSKDGKIN